jgi:ornithine carbamoyltransferase
LLAKAGGRISVTSDLREAAAGSTVLYTDVWVSMGKEQESEQRVAQLQGYQINEELCRLAPGALVMHCLPAYRGKEIDAAIFEANAETIFRQAENRLHTQKAILSILMQ